MKLLFLQNLTSPLIPKVTWKCFYTKYYQNELLKTRKKRYQKKQNQFKDQIIQLPMKQSGSYCSLEKKILLLFLSIY